MHKQVWEGTDRACPHADQDAGIVIGEALEIAPQPAPSRRLRHAVAGQREMIETDRPIAARHELGMPQRRHGEALLHIRQRAGIDPALTREQARHMRIAKQCNARGHHAHGRFQCRGQIVERLARQSVHEVKSHRDADPAEALHCAFHHVQRLDATDPRLHGRGKGLHAQIDPADPHDPHRVNPRPVQSAGVQFHGDLRIARVEAADHLLKQADEIDQRQAVWAAPAKGDARDMPATAKALGRRRNLLFQRIDIGGQTMAAIGSAGVAPAIPAYVMAIGNVQIERDGGALGNLVDPLQHRVGAHSVAELRGRGIAGVAGHGSGEQFGMIGPHAACLAWRGRGCIALDQNSCCA